MAKIIRHWKSACLKEATSTGKKPYEQWAWRQFYVNEYGHLILGESEFKRPGEQFVYFDLEDYEDRYLRTTYGDVTITSDELTILTPNTKYIFSLKEAEELPIDASQSNLTKDSSRNPFYFYRFCLEECACDASCSFSRAYIGNEKNIKAVAENMKKQGSYSDTCNAIQRYFTGDTLAQHMIAYEQIPVLEPVITLKSFHFILQDYEWIYQNVYSFPYFLRSKKIILHKTVFQYQNQFLVGMKAQIVCFQYQNSIGKWTDLNNRFWGNICIFNTDPSHKAFSTLLYVIIGKYDDKEKAIAAAKAVPQSIDLSKICEDIFGNG